MKIADIPFQFVGNNPSLDLANTRVLQGGETIDLIEAPERLADWLEMMGAPSFEQWTKSEINALYRLRDACSEISMARIEGADATKGALKTINAHLQCRPDPQVLSLIDNKFELSVSSEEVTPRFYMACIARELAMLVTETDQKRLKTCAHDECVLMFKDTSKSGRRRWCNMETCGNRAKAKAYRNSHSR